MAVLAPPAPARARPSPQTGIVDLATDPAGRIDSAASGDRAATAAKSAGDVNGDGRPDFIVDAPLADNNGRTDSGSAYVVFGDGALPTLDLVDIACRGFRIDGAQADDQAGYSVSGAGDVNGDGRADVIVGGPNGDLGGTDSGSAYVVFGKPSVEAVQL